MGKGTKEGSLAADKAKGQIFGLCQHCEGRALGTLGGTSPSQTSLLGMHSQENREI